ncbi:MULTISPECIES: acetolactate decarboxylase [Clostridium]|uniref:acetolactate decarboxylase n=1 Tax=Clostridium TaxID=1485 RepID=UPI00098C9395|nr:MULTISPECIES: acetolactate decarboxylase [Clostridium]MBA8932387.1 acetolactate decarboxylase [Clostridium beijerinckii]NOW07479.1 acetolactate decarboxylase [Clostridium beijerinckii]NRT37642.1 acetolactate decarboxylase [Clostridium beijerinckii]NRT48614.1 acetolactate decarboxylase [Clostridium beijerinckii]NRU36591.1 acetolactate decarboxylase [Clostridium beijerinckii]
MNNYLQTKKTDTFTHLSTSMAFCQGVLDTDINLEDIRQFGDFGFGSTAGLQDPFIMLDNEIYFSEQIPSKRTLNLSLLTFLKPDPDKHVLISHMNKKQLGEYFQSIIPTKNIAYAVRFDGSFEFIELSRFPSFEKPYPKLTPEDIDRSKKTELRNITGTLVGFWLPDYAKKVNSGANKLHLHFISSDKKFFGHVTDCEIINGNMAIDYKHSINIVLPKNDDFYATDIDNVDDRMVKGVSTWTQKDR